jgi:hypothetical protein
MKKVDDLSVIVHENGSIRVVFDKKDNTVSINIFEGKHHLHMCFPTEVAITLRDELDRLLTQNSSD